MGPCGRLPREGAEGWRAGLPILKEEAVTKRCQASPASCQWGSFLLDGDVSLFLEKRLFLLGRLVLALLCLVAQTEPKNHDQNKSRR